jgi:hypothetical protein
LSEYFGLGIGVTWLRTLVRGGEGNKSDVLRTADAFILRPTKCRFFFFFFFFLSLHHPNDHFENTSIFYLPLFSSAAKENSV